MPLNQSKGNMYEFVTHTWNTVKGECPHGCSYCYMKRFGKQNPVRFDESELMTDLGKGNFIFVGSSCDLFAESIPEHWIQKTINKCFWSDNCYLFQSKNPARMAAHLPPRPGQIVACTTIETNRNYPEIMKNSPEVLHRVLGLKSLIYRKYVTIEPILDFDLDRMVELIKMCDPYQVNIGADSGGNNLPEPKLAKVMRLIDELNKFTTVVKKRNFNRLKD